MTLQLYDCSSADPRSLYLTGEATSVDYNAVGFSYPAGTIRLKGTYKFTHFKASDMQGGTGIYRILRRRCIAGDLIEYDYEVDYIKDYWLRVGHFNGFKVRRCTDDRFWKRYHTERQELSGVLSNQVQNGYNINLDNAKIMLVMNGLGDRPIRDAMARTVSVYMLNVNHFTVLLNQIFDDEITRGFFLSDLIGCYIIPFFNTSVSGCIYHMTDKVTFPINVLGEKTGYFTLSNQSTATPDFPWITQTADRVSVTLQTNLSTTIADYSDLYPYKTYRLYVPFVGWTTFDPMNVKGDIAVTYEYDLVDGTVKAYLSGTDTDIINISEPVQLPQLPITQATNDLSGLKLAFSALSGLSTLNPSQAFNSLLSGSINTFESHIATGSSPTGHSNISNFEGLTNLGFRLVTRSTHTIDTVEQFGDMYGYFTDETYDVIIEDGLSAGSRIWLDPEVFRPICEDWYAANLRAEIFSNYLLYNPPTN